MLIWKIFYLLFYAIQLFYFLASRKIDLQSPFLHLNLEDWSSYHWILCDKNPSRFSTCSILRFHSPLFVLIWIMVSHDAHLKNRLVKTVSSNSTPQIAQYLTRASPLGVTSSISLAVDMILLLNFFFIYFFICTQKAIIQSCKTNQIVLIIKK